MPKDIGRYLIVGLLIATVIATIFPNNYLHGIMGRGIIPMLFMMAAGIPMYVCATASVPIAAALITAGVSPGAALVFLLTGPATNAATITTIWKTFGPRTAAVYLGSIAAGALAAGFIVDFISAGAEHGIAAVHSWAMPGYINIVSAAALLIILIPTLFKAKKTTCRGESGCKECE
jgi:hypothetical protein